MTGTKVIWNKFDLLSRRRSLIVFSLFFSWLLAFPFNGRVLHALAYKAGVDIRLMVFYSVAAHFVGLILWGFAIRTMAAARRLMLFSIAFAMATTALFFLPPFWLWTPCLALASFLTGGCVASWGFFFRAFTPPKERIKTAADALIGSNLLMIFLNIAAMWCSPFVGLGLCLLVLTGAGLFALRLPIAEAGMLAVSEKQQQVSVAKPLAFLYLFIAIITFNSGLMYQVLNPAFEHLDWLVSWYWALPYVAALYIMRNLPQTVNRTYILYAAIAMIGFAFLAFSVFDRSAGSYLVINTLMLGAFGIYDLFWWSILGEMLDLSANAAMILGIGLSANVLGVLTGGIIGQAIGADGGRSSSLLALAIVCTVMVILPPLSKYLGNVLNTHIYLTSFMEMTPEKQQRTIRIQVESGVLTERESEIATLIIQGRTYKQVASELYISENTVKTHVKNIYAKYGVQNRNQLLHLVMESKK